MRVGDKLDFTAPIVLGYGFGKWRLQPADGTPEGTFAPQNTRPAAPDAVGGDVQVGAFNVLNYFVTLTVRTRRGATTPAGVRAAGRQDRAGDRGAGADVVTLMEIEDTDSTGYSPATPTARSPTWSAGSTPPPATTSGATCRCPTSCYAVDRDVIRSAIIYQNDVVQPVGDPVGLVDEDVWYNAREPQAQTFVKDGDKFTVVANHFKSKSPGAPTGDNVDTGDGQGEWNGDRMRQAASLAAFADELRASTGDDDVVLLGDFNAYTQEDPIEVLREAGYTDLGSGVRPGPLQLRVRRAVGLAGPRARHARR